MSGIKDKGAGLEEQVAMLVGMGFTAVQANRTLERCGGNVDDAIDILCRGESLSVVPVQQKATASNPLVNAVYPAAVEEDCRH